MEYLGGGMGEAVGVWGDGQEQGFEVDFSKSLLNLVTS